MSAVSGAASTVFSVVCVSGVSHGSANIPGVYQTVQCISDCIIDVWRGLSGVNRT